jgi:hypothetical protein
MIFFSECSKEAVHNFPKSKGQFLPFKISLLISHIYLKCFPMFCNTKTNEENIMKKYMLSFFGGNPALRFDNLDQASIEARNKHNDAWNIWIDNLVQTGRFENGYPLTAEGRKVSPDGIEEYVFDGDTAGGFIVIKADSSDEAAQIAELSPLIKNGGYVLVRLCGEINK